MAIWLQAKPLLEGSSERFLSNSLVMGGWFPMPIVGVQSSVQSLLPAEAFRAGTNLNATLTRGVSVSISDVVSRPEQILRPSTRAISSIGRAPDF